MSKELERVLDGILTDEENEVTLMQLCRFCDLTPDNIVELVSEGILEPTGVSRHDWHFSFTTIERVKKVKRLRNDFELNVTGVGLVMHLLDEIEKLEALVSKMS